METKNDFKKVVKLINSGKKYPAVSLVRQSPEVAAMISKLVRNRDPAVVDLHNKQGFYNMDTTQFQTVTDSVSDRIRNSKNAMQLFPDLELSAQILISSILSPKDMVSGELIYKVNEEVLPSDVTMQMLDVLKSDLDKQYKLREKLADILRECLFGAGAYIKAVIPEGSVDEIINSNIVPSTESLRDKIRYNSFGVLGDNTDTAEQNTYSVESYGPSTPPNPVIFDKLEVTDNYNFLSVPKAKRAIASNKIKNLIRASTESYAPPKSTYGGVDSMFFKDVDQRERPFVPVTTPSQTKRASIGRPLDMRIPAEATIPVYPPGEPENHIGYFVILDNEGNPVTYNTDISTMSNANVLVSDHSKQMSSMLLQKAKNNLIGSDVNDINIQQMSKIYMDIVEADLKNRLKNGVHGAKLELTKRNELYRVMLARTLAGQFTRIVYVPAELVTYFALKYHDNGTGKSLLDDLRVILSMRGIILFAKVMAQAKSSISLTHVNMTLDPNDPDPQKTIEMSINEIIKMRQQYFPLGINTPMDLVDWIQRAGFEFSFEGHPGLPQTKFEFESKNIQHQLPDNELDESLRKQTIMACGLSPETVDNGFNSEFATTVVSNNILLSKRIVQTQNEFTPHVTDYAKKIITNDFKLRKSLKSVIHENLSKLDKSLSTYERQLRDSNEEAFKDYMLDKFTANLELTLPKPDITAIENQSAAFDQYAEALDKAIEHWVSSSFLTQDVVGDVSNNIDTIKSILKSYFLRKWMSENGYLTELADISADSTNNKEVVDIYNMTKDHIQSVLKNALVFIKNLEATRMAADKDVADMAVEPGSTDTSSSSDTSSDSGSDDSGSEGDMGGDEDLGGIEDEGLGGGDEGMSI